MMGVPSKMWIKDFSCFQNCWKNSRSLSQEDPRAKELTVSQSSLKVKNCSGPQLPQMLNRVLVMMMAITPLCQACLEVYMSWSIQALGTVFGVCQSSRYCPGAARAPEPVSGLRAGGGWAGLGWRTLSPVRISSPVMLSCTCGRTICSMPGHQHLEVPAGLPCEQHLQGPVNYSLACVWR